MTEQDKHFLRVMQEHLLHYGQIPKEDVAKLMAMARRPTRKALQDEIERLRAALWFYADKNNYSEQLVHSSCWCCSDYEDAKIATDEGAIARAALEGEGTVR